MLNKIITILIMLSLFLWSAVFFRTPFEFYISYLIFVIMLPFFIFRFGVPKWPVLLFVPLLISGLVYCAVGKNELTLFFKVFIGFFVSSLFYHYVIQLFNFNLKLLFRYYMIAAVIVSLIGIFQLVSFNVGFTPGYDYRWLLNKWGYSFGGLGIRMNSIFSEPSYFAALVAPAFFVSIYNISTRYTLFISRRASFIVVIAYALTFSSVGILGAFLTIILLLVNFGVIRYSLVFIPLFVLAFQYSYENVPEFRDRWVGTIEIFTTANYKSYQIHGSSFVLYNNYHVALENFKENPLFGTGLGSHPVAFDRFSYTNLIGAVDIDFNKMDANSMFLRLMSETGIYGLFIFIMLLIKCWVFKASAKSREHWVMSNALAIIILLYLLRQGHYFLNGFPFFVWMFYYLAKENWGELDESDGLLKESSGIPQLQETSV